MKILLIPDSDGLSDFFGSDIPAALSDFLAVTDSFRFSWHAALRRPFFGYLNVDFDDWIFRYSNGTIGISKSFWMHFRVFLDVKYRQAFPSLSGCEIPAFPSLSGCEIPAFPSFSGCEIPAFPSLSGCEIPAFLSFSGCEIPAFLSLSGCEIPARSMIF
ncbi:unnamed protein product [Rhizophagus irregularis]|nr:unnamed protein product [Rhizophagus irregularis]CAB4441006.1 unnamed protein product [Rhizophagus irregularis]